MSKRKAARTGLFLLMLAAAIGFSQAPQRGNGNKRGRYLVEEVARCWECHTPMLGQGQWDQSKWMDGAAVWFRPVKPITDWGYQAPRIAGLRNYSDEQVRTILEKGIGPNGLGIRLPMHTYHMSPEDAQSIIAYLRFIAKN